MSISEKEAVLRERAAFERGVGELWVQPAISATPQACRAYDEALSRAAENYALPKVTRPRVERIDGTKGGRGSPLFLSVRDGELCFSYHLDGPLWHPVKAENVAMNRSLQDDFNVIVTHGAALLANPTEEVDE